MGPNRVVQLFHVGPQKSGTTWIYRCLAEHPGVAVPPRDSIHFFDMHFGRGDGWYLEHFQDALADQPLFDPTPSYLRSPWAPRRIAAHNPGARIAVCLRHPVQRAFSHYWHEKKKGRIAYEFQEVLDNYDLYSLWLEPGFYAEHLRRYLDHFPRDQILTQRFETLQRDPAAFLRELLEFYGVEAAFRPTVLHQPINVAGPRRTLPGLGLYTIQKLLRISGLSRVAGVLARTAPLSGRGEYVRGIPDDVNRRLVDICEPEITRLEQLLAIDLSDWRDAQQLSQAA